MVKDDHNTDRPADANGATERPAARRITLGAVIASTLVAAVLTVSGVFLVQWLTNKPEANGQVPQANGPVLFQGWNKPDFVLLLSGQQHGYMLPCGCSWPQVGGLERRYNFLESLKGRGWPVLALDLGDIPQDKGPRDLPNVQGLIKYRYSMQALSKMDYGGVGVGAYEARMPMSLENALGSVAQANGPPIVVGNLVRGDNAIFREETVTWRLAEVPGTKFKVAVVSVVGPDVADEIKQRNGGTVEFEKVSAALQGNDKDPNKPGLLKEVRQHKPDLQVLLYQGPVENAKACAKAFPNFQVVLCLSTEDEPPARPEMVVHPNNSTTMIVTVGHKGKNVGVVGCFAKNGRPADGFDLQYQMARMDVNLVTPKAKEKDHPVLQLMEQYTQELKDKKYLTKYDQYPHQLQAEAKKAGLAIPTFVGSDNCAKCHDSLDDSVTIWKASGHAHAYETLEKAERPSLRQFDAECVVCHVVGFGYTSGFKGFDGLDPVKDKDEWKRQKSLLNVGCESCHGPGSEHARNPKNMEWRNKINPFRYIPEQAEKARKGDPAAILAEKKRTNGLDQFCQKCHDQDNDVNWQYNLKWPKVEHRSPAP